MADKTLGRGRSGFVDVARGNERRDGVTGTLQRDAILAPALARSLQPRLRNLKFAAELRELALEGLSLGAAMLLRGGEVCEASLLGALLLLVALGNRSAQLLVELGRNTANVNVDLDRDLVPKLRQLPLELTDAKRSGLARVRELRTLGTQVLDLGRVLGVEGRELRRMLGLASIDACRKLVPFAAKVRLCQLPTRALGREPVAMTQGLVRLVARATDVELEFRNAREKLTAVPLGALELFGERFRALRLRLGLEPGRAYELRGVRLLLEPLRSLAREFVVVFAANPFQCSRVLGVAFGQGLFAAKLGGLEREPGSLGRCRMEFVRVAFARGELGGVAFLEFAAKGLLRQVGSRKLCVFLGDQIRVLLVPRGELAA